jgi:guanidinobutyrase
MTDLDMLALLLRPAGGGVHMVSTGKAAQLELQRRLYGAADAGGVETGWRAALGQVASARVAILAVPSDTGAGLVRGAAFGPAGLRAAILEEMPDFPARAARAGIVDVGDVFVVPQLLHDEMLSQAQLDATRAAIYPSLDPAAAARLPVSPLSMAETAATLLYRLNPALKIFTLGGDHSVAWPVVSALAAHRGRARPFAIVHPDAHTDLLPARLGVKYCFATWAYHANELVGRGGRLVQVGVRASGRPRAHWESTLGVRQFWADDLSAFQGGGPGAPTGIDAGIDRILAHLRGLGDTIDGVYLSNDIDGTDALAAPATGAPEPGGLSVAFMRRLIRRLGREASLIGADLVEVAPPVGDPAASRRTIEVGARYVLDSLAVLAGSDELMEEREEA